LLFLRKRVGEAKMQIQSTLSNSQSYEPSSYVNTRVNRGSTDSFEPVSQGIIPFESAVPLSQKAYQIFDKLTVEFSTDSKLEAQNIFNEAILSDAANKYMTSRGIERLDQQQVVQQFFDQYGGTMPDGVIASMLNSRISESVSANERNFLTQFRDLLEEPTISLDISI